MKHRFIILALVTALACAAQPTDRKQVEPHGPKDVATNPMPVPSPVWDGEVVEVHDGDTCTVRLFEDDEVQRIVSLRLKDVWAAELWNPGGKEARAKLAALLPVGTRVRVRRFAVKSDKPWGPRYLKTFSRYVATLWIVSDGRCVNEMVK